MQFFLYEIVARAVAIYLCVSCGRKLWYGFVERKIECFNPDLIGSFLTWLINQSVVYRDTTPVRYWIEIGLQIFILAACLVVAIFGWWHPNT